MASLATIAASLQALHARMERMERNLAAGPANDDQWTRLPSTKTRCPISGWSRSTILRHIDSGKVRTKSVGGSRYYSGADVLALLTT